LGVAQGAALSIGAVLGTGVIALPALGARVAGPASLLAWGILVALSVPLAVTTILTAVAEVVVVTAMNAGGVRLSGRVQLVLAGVLGTLLLVATLSALPHADLANLRPFAPHGWFAVVSAAAVLVWGFAGWEAVTSLAGEYRRPARDRDRDRGDRRALPRRGRDEHPGPGHGGRANTRTAGRL
jgi:amino acid transporter